MWWRVSIVAVALVVFGSGPPAGGSDQIVPAPGTRLVLDAGSLGAIDGGLRLDEPTFETPEVQIAGVSDDDDLPYVPGKVIVKFRAGVPAATLAALADSVEARRVDSPPYANYKVLTIGRGEDPEAVARELAAHPDVEYAQADYRVELAFTPNDPLYSRQWSFPALDMEKAWDINTGATRDVIVGVLDSGIAYRNVIIRYNTRPFTVFSGGRLQTINYGLLDVPYAAAPDLIGAERIVAPLDLTWNDPNPVDTLGHGTHVAGTIGQLTNNGVGVAGMAFNVRLMPVKVAAGSNWDTIFGAPSPFFSDDQTARAIRYAADNGARAINMSFVRFGGPAPVVEDALRYAVSKGTFCVFAAGNSALAGNPLSRFAEIASRIDGVVAVGALGPTLERARYSSTGTFVELCAPGGDLAPPGSQIPGGILQQTLDQSLFLATLLVPPRFDGVVYAAFSGTSMAAPHVTGFAALLIQQGLTDPAAIEVAMKRFATDKGVAGRDDEYGVGMINPRATLRGLGLAK